MMLDPGDVRIPELEAVLFGLEELRAMALEGYSAQEIAVANGWRLEDVRKAAAIMGFSVSPHVIRQELCPVCGYLLMPDKDGKHIHCEICALRLRLERLNTVNSEEQRREAERLENQIDVVKQTTHRIRAKLGTTPREGSTKQRVGALD